MKTFQFLVNDKGKPIMNGNEFSEYLKKNKLKKGFMKVYIYDTRDKKSIAGYYHNVILEKLRIAYYDIDNEIMTIKQIERRIWCDLNVCEVFSIDEINIFKMDVNEISVLIEMIKRFAATELKYYIE